MVMVAGEPFTKIKTGQLQQTDLAQHLESTQDGLESHTHRQGHGRTHANKHGAGRHTHRHSTHAYMIQTQAEADMDMASHGDGDPHLYSSAKGTVPAITHLIRIDSETEKEKALFAHHHHGILMQVVSALPTYALCLL